MLPFGRHVWAVLCSLLVLALLQLFAGFPSPRGDQSAGSVLSLWSVLGSVLCSEEWRHRFLIEAVNKRDNTNGYGVVLCFMLTENLSLGRRKHAFLLQIYTFFWEDAVSACSTCHP